MLSVKDFGATGDGTTDDTTAIQNAINHASNNNIETVYFPPGHYIYTTLYMYYDATDNPGFQQSPSRDGRIRLLGDGRLAITNLKFYDGTNPDVLYGSVLDCGSGGGIIINPNASFAVNSRKFEAEQITFIANNTTQIINCQTNPGLSFDTCSFKQINPAGDGIIAKGAWFFTMNNCYVFGLEDPDTPTPSTGRGIIGGTWTFAGLWSISESLIDSFQDGVVWQDGSFVNVSLRDSAIQNCTRYGFYADGGVIHQLLMDNVYFENVSTIGTSFIKGDGSGTSSAVIRNMKLSSVFMLCGTDAPATRITGPAIDVNSIENFEMNNCFFYRMLTPVVNIADTKNSQAVSGKVTNCTFLAHFDLSSVSQFFLFTGILPSFENITYTGQESGFYGSAKCKLFDDTVAGQFPRNYVDLKGTAGFSRFGFGDTSVETVTSGPYNIGAVEESKTYYDLEHSIAGGLAVYLPDNSELNDGRLFIVKNSAGSSGAFPNIIVYNNTEKPGEPTVVQLAFLRPGETALFIFDGQNTEKFKLVSKIGETFDLVEDPTPQLGGNLDLNSNDITGTGDINIDGSIVSESASVISDATNATFRVNADGGNSLTSSVYQRAKSSNGSNAETEIIVTGSGGETISSWDFKADTSAGALSSVMSFDSSGDVTFRGSATIDGLTYPTADGTNGQVITTDGAGTLSFADAGGGFDPNVDNPTIGNGASAGTDSVSIGHDAIGSGASSVLIGQNADGGTSSRVTAVGSDVTANGADSVAVGHDANAESSSTAVGAESRALSSLSCSFGYGADALASSSVAVGYNSSVATIAGFGVAVGRQATVGNDNGVAVGYFANASAVNTLALGYNTNSTGTSSLAVGDNATASGINSLAAGHDAQATAVSAVAVGDNAQATGSGQNAIAIGHDSSAPANSAIAIGNGANVYDNNSYGGYAVAIGFNASVEGSYGIAIGRQADVGFNNSYGIAIGYLAQIPDSSYQESMALGAYATVEADNAMHINTSGSSTNKPTANGEIVIESDDARLQYKSSRFDLIGGDTRVEGLLFGSDTATANTLDDYEEGDWTPTFSGATTAGAFTYSTQIGKYTKIGRQVIAVCEIQISAITTAAAGNLRIDGLPFNNGGGAKVGALLSQIGGFGASNNPSGGEVSSAGTRVLLKKYSSADPRDGLTAGTDSASLSTTARVRVTVAYNVA